MDLWLEDPPKETSKEKEKKGTIMFVPHGWQPGTKVVSLHFCSELYPQPIIHSLTPLLLAP
jgi:hypothetical protein